MNGAKIRMGIFAVVVVGMALSASPAFAQGLVCLYHDEHLLLTNSAYTVQIVFSQFEADSSSGHVFAKSSGFGMGSAYWNYLDSQISGECSNLDYVLDSDSDASPDLFEYGGVEVWVQTLLDEWCSGTSAMTLGEAKAYWGYAYVHGESGLHQYYLYNEDGWPDGTIRAWDSINGFATSQSRAESYSSYSFSSPPAFVSIEFSLQRNVMLYSQDCYNFYDYYVGSTDFRSTSLITFGDTKMVWRMADGTERNTSIQGVMAQVVDAEGYNTICMGTLRPPGGECDTLYPLYHYERFDVVPPSGNVVGVDITCVIDAFDGFDGDIDADGVVCADDLQLMGLLVDRVTVIEDGYYVARADFNLDGVINGNDLSEFLLLYQELPDCNDNDNPDACDIETGVSLDVNENGIPDECE